MSACRENRICSGEKLGKDTGLPATQVADSDGGHLHRGFRNARNAEDGARGRVMGKVLRKNFVEFLIVLHVLKVNLDINDVIHREARGFNDFADVIETLTRLSRKISREGSIGDAWTLPRNIYIVPGIKAVRTQINWRMSHREAAGRIGKPPEKSRHTAKIKRRFTQLFPCARQPGSIAAGLLRSFLRLVEWSWRPTRCDSAS